jgi:SWI/SNF-related matrix-associated actin-dependent regulator 1 of chromatin subfamily A
LEPLITQDVPLDISAATRRSPAFTEVAALSGALAGADDDDLLLARLTHGTDGPLATLRRELGELKVEAAAQWVAERLDCGTQKIIVFGWHTRVLAHLHRTLVAYQPVIITGSTPPKLRLEAELAFQNKPEVRVMVGQILACGTAITLTAASEVAIMEPSWVPAENSQAIDRAHRLGQHDSVLASFLYVPGTLDERIMRVFRRKAEEVAQLHEPTTTIRETT